MVRLKNKPNSCKNCPFCYVEDKYFHGVSGVEHKEYRYCGVMRGTADLSACPLK